MEKSSERLANELERLGFTNLAEKARQDLYHDFQSPSATPSIDLVRDLDQIAYRSAAARELRQRVIDGEFDATREESDKWAEGPEGQEAMGRLIRGD